MSLHDELEAYGLMTASIVDPAPDGRGWAILVAPPEIERIFIRVVEDLQDEIRSGMVEVVPESVQRSLMFGSQKEVFRNWTKPGQCQYPGCNARSIRRSHTLQRGGPLTQLKSADGHVIAPTMDYKRETIVYKRTGLESASTFPGFCQKHENIFAVFETRGTLEKPLDFILQLYRTAAREAVRTAFDIEHHQRLSKEYDAQWNRNFGKLALTRSPPRVAEHPVVQNYSYSTESPERSTYDKWMQIASADLLTIRGMVADLELAVAALDQGILGAHVHRYVLPYKLPVTLSGQSAANVRIGSEQFRFLFFVVVIPEASSTQVMIASRTEDGQLLDVFLRLWGLLDESRQDDADKLVGLIEDFLFIGTDHWFFNEAYWKSLPPAAQAALLASVVDEGQFGIFRAPIPVLPRLAGNVAQRMPLTRLPRSPFQRRQDVRTARGWRTFERLPTMKSRKLMAARKFPAMAARADNYNDDIFVFSRNIRDRGWVFVRTLRLGHWVGPWRSVKWVHLAPYGL